VTGYASFKNNHPLKRKDNFLVQSETFWFNVSKLYFSENEGFKK